MSRNKNVTFTLEQRIEIVNKAIKIEREEIIQLCKKKIQSPELCERVTSAINERPCIELKL